jgi:general secretion pathway protein J
MTSRRKKQAGFTLVEMLIALTIFGMLTAGGVALLSFSVTSQEMTERQLATLSSIRRAGSLLTADLAQAAPRPWRDGSGVQQPAFAGAAGRETRVLVFVRGGWDNPDQLPRASLQRVEYRLQAGRLIRIGYTNVDGGGAAAVTTLINEVQQLQLRFRDREGLWRDVWQPADPAELPVAVELIASSARFGPVRQLFLVGTGG